MRIEIIGPHPLERDASGRQRTRIGTHFPSHHTLITQPLGVHASQRNAFIDHLNAKQTDAGLATLTLVEEIQLCGESVDLIFEPDEILIRPNPDRMDLAFQADEQLCEFASKRQVKFLLLSDARVSRALREHGEFWRLSSIPKTHEGKIEWILRSKVAIQNQSIYFYNRFTGTRFLTCDEFGKLGRLESAALARQLGEIAEHCARRNRLDFPELDFFAADLESFGAGDFAGLKFETLSTDEVRATYERLSSRFRGAVHEAFRKDDLQNRAWLDRMVQTLFLQGNEAETEQVPDGLSSEFFLRIEWLPGGCFEEGEFLPDSVFDESSTDPRNTELQRLCDPKAKGIIFNFIREFGDLEHINLGRIPESLSLDRPQRRGRRGVYLALFKSRSQPQAMIRRFIRLQKWGVWEHLDDNEDLLQAIEASEEYTDYCLDRRLGCRQLGMNLVSRVTVRRLSETYQGKNKEFCGQTIRTTYFERDYLEGIATDKLPPERFTRPGYAVRFAQILGKAAASSMIVGRSLDFGHRPVFDDGDEVVIENPEGQPVEIFIGDHSGAFGEYQQPLETFAEHYAQPVYRRVNFLPDAREFAEKYLASFRGQFIRIQGDYRKRRRGFDTLFKHCKYDPNGSFGYRWECVLKRLDATDADQLMASIRNKIWILPPKP